MDPDQRKPYVLRIRLEPLDRDFQANLGLYPRVHFLRRADPTDSLLLFPYGYGYDLETPNQVHFLTETYDPHIPDSQQDTPSDGFQCLGLLSGIRIIRFYTARHN